MFDWFHNKVPYTDFQQKNLDWLTETVREGEAAVEAKIEEADDVLEGVQSDTATAVANAEAATTAANTAKTGADNAAASANAAATAANNAKDAANTAAANAQAAADKWATPYASTTVAGMTDHAKIYVYTGTEVGYTAGNWYYWNGTAWTSGGVYVGDISDAVLFSTAQSKTDVEKTQARENCGAADETVFNNFLNGNSSEFLHDTELVYGAYDAGEPIGDPGVWGYRVAYTKLIPVTLQDVSFVFNSSGVYKIAFVGFDADGLCDSTPLAWLSDGTYTLSQIISNARITTSPYFSFQMKRADDAVISPTIVTGRQYTSLTYKNKISTDSVKNGAITESKLSAEVQTKLNGGAGANLVDVFLFMGQSNMAGRGESADAPTIISGAGYEYKAISSPNTLTPMAEPFGYAENQSGGINDGTGKTGSMVVAFTNAYYLHNGRIPVVGVSASEGGTTISQWTTGTAKLNDAISRLSSCLTYLSNNGYTVRHKYVLWCQGESDGDNNTTASDYKTAFDAMVTSLKSAGIEKLFMVRIGNYNSGESTKYDTIMNCQTGIAQTEADVVMASTDFAGMRARGLMKDQFHYYQAAYNEVGTYSGVNVALYEQTGKEPTMYDTKSSDLYYTHKN